jgi:site-specific recombinase XerD
MENIEYFGATEIINSGLVGSKIANISAGLEDQIDLMGYDKKTRDKYVFDLRRFFEFAHKNPKIITISDVKLYFEYLKFKGKSPAAINRTLSAIELLYLEIWEKHSFLEIQNMKTQIPILRIPCRCK